MIRNFRAFSIMTFMILMGTLISASTLSTYNISVQLYPEEHTLKGWEEVHFINKNASFVNEIYFNLMPNLLEKSNPKVPSFINSSGYANGFDPGYTRVSTVTETDGTPLSFYTATSITHSPQTYSNSDTMLVVKLPYQLKRGDEFDLRIYFSTHFPLRSPVQDEGTDGSMYVWRFGWYPLEVATVNGKWTQKMIFTPHTASIRIRVPKKFRIALGCDTIEEKTNRNMRIVMGQTNSPHLSIPIVITARHEKLTFRTPSTIFDIYYLPEDEAKARELVTYAMNAYDKYTGWFGPSGYSRVSIVESKASGSWGMASDGLILLANGVFNDVDMVVPHLLTPLSFYLVAHETAHLWWGIGVGVDFWSENYLSEALAEYSSKTLIEEKYGLKKNILNYKLKDIVIPILDNILPIKSLRDYALYDYISTLRNGYDEPIELPTNECIENAYHARIYDKAYLALKTIEGYVGKDEFIDALKEYHTLYAHHLALSGNFFSTVSKVTHNKEIERYAKDWILGVNTVDLAVDKVKVEKKNDEFENKIFISKRGNGIVPILVEYKFRNGKEMRYSYGSLTSPSTVLTLSSTSSIDAVSVDPDFDTLDFNRFNNNYPRKIKINAFPQDNSSPLETYSLAVIPYFYAEMGENLEPTAYDTRIFLAGKGLFHTWAIGYSSSYSSSTMKQVNSSALGSFSLILNDYFDVSAFFEYPQSGDLWANLSLNAAIPEKRDIGDNAITLLKTNNISLGYSLSKEASSFLNSVSINYTRNEFQTLGLTSWINLTGKLKTYSDKTEQSVDILQGNSFMYQLFPQIIVNLKDIIGTSIGDNALFSFNLSDYMKGYVKPIGNYLGYFRADLMIPFMKDIDTRFFNLVSLRDINFSLFTELGDAWNDTNDFSHNTRISIGNEIGFSLKTMGGMPFVANIGYSSPVYNYQTNEHPSIYFGFNLEPLTIYSTLYGN